MHNSLLEIVLKHSFLRYYTFPLSEKTDFQEEMKKRLGIRFSKISKAMISGNRNLLT